MKKVKRYCRLLLIKIKDAVSGQSFASINNRGVAPFNHQINLSLEIKQNPDFENKIFNLSLASEKINKVIVLPNQVFSFWKIIGSPYNEYMPGRVIIKGKLSQETGGGLCQLSGAIYYISILSGLEIVERHSHSLDLYTDKTRYTPLGTDATVVYGYKDLRIKNNFGFPIRYESKIENGYLNIRLCSTEKIIQKRLIFDLQERGEKILVSVKDEYDTIINLSRYTKENTIF